MHPNSTFASDYLSPPGETLQDVLEERQMTQAELAERSGLSRKTVNEIVKGKAPITSQTALILEKIFGMPARFWNTREQVYREGLARRQEDEHLREQINWIQQFPYREMARLGMVKPIDGRGKDATLERGRALLSFFGVATPAQWREVWLTSSAAFRKALTFSSDPYSVSAWLRFGEKTALEQLETARFDESYFRASLRKIRNLTTKVPDVFAPEVVKLCSDAGVAVVFTPQLPRARVSGATQWLNQDLALIQISLRYRTDDHFWFTFFHESAHILLHGKRDVFLEGSEADNERQKEEEANRWAEDFLIPSRRLRQFVAVGEFSRRAVERFADELGIAPGIVVGQLQHRSYIPYSHLNHLKRRFVWKVSTPN